MKALLFIVFLAFSVLAKAQMPFPDLLEGTWKHEQQDLYEHWDRLAGQNLKGLSYEVKKGRMEIREYLELEWLNGSAVYTATVPDQNSGEGITFLLKRSDSVLVFENPAHDFPKRISYQRINDNALVVTLSDLSSKVISYQLHRQNPSKDEQESNVANPNYDAALAQKWGADDYGMKSYILVMLKSGSNTSTDKAFLSDSFRSHMDNINRLVDEGKMIVAGPLGKNEQKYRGIFILDTSSFEEASSLLQGDAAISNDILAYELYPWYGSAALPAYLEVSDQIWKLAP